jgi:GntR family transcriptional regulator
MDISILFSSKKPIYEQITDQVIAQILNGELQEGTQLPSIRSLAKELTVSVVTTKRAYEELEKEGYIHTVLGKGSFIASQNTDSLKSKQIELTKNELRRIIPECKKHNLELSEIQQLVQNIYEEE